MEARGRASRCQMSRRLISFLRESFAPCVRMAALGGGHRHRGSSPSVTDRRVRAIIRAYPVCIESMQWRQRRRKRRGEQVTPAAAEPGSDTEPSTQRLAVSQASTPPNSVSAVASHRRTKSSESPEPVLERLDIPVPSGKELRQVSRDRGQHPRW